MIPSLRPWRYFLTDFTVSGAAPKNFIRVYDHTSGRRTHPPSWPAYIAKVGHKWYPAESITEQLMTRLGEILGLRMANSRLMVCDGQIRFLSRYFLQREESLVHAAEILGGYLADDKFVAAVGEEKLEQDVFTFAVFCEAIRARFPANADDIILDFVRMIGFDAIAGNQDRHLYNWGVIVHPTGIRPPRFSPIFDTARGLFWNEPETQLIRFDSDQSLRSYVEKAQPLIGWEGQAEVNHFSLVRQVANHDARYRTALSSLCLPSTLPRIHELIEQELRPLLSASRRALIERCLALRIELFLESVGKAIC
ncbi:MAG: HipA domain-containing protein [Gemmatimonadota bacterium]|nr:HipA domain-containing protein [Gemmatimonadota bacterium]